MSLRVGLLMSLALAAGNADARVPPVPTPSAYELAHPEARHIHVGPGVVAPVFIRATRPDAPSWLHGRRCGICPVVVQVVIDKAGKVVDPVVLSSPDKRLDALAVEAVASWRYEPATINGKRTPVFWTITITFRVPEP